MSRFFGTSARSFIRFLGFKVDKLPAVYKKSLETFTEPGGVAERKLGTLKEVYIKSRNGNPVHQSHFNRDDKEFIISARIVGSRDTKTCHIYNDGTGTVKKGGASGCQAHTSTDFFSRPPVLSPTYTAFQFHYTPNFLAKPVLDNEPHENYIYLLIEKLFPFLSRKVTFGLPRTVPPWQTSIPMSSIVILHPSHFVQRYSIVIMGHPRIQGQRIRTQVATRMAEAGLQTLLLEAGGPSYGITGGDLDSRRPAWLDGTNLTRVDVPGLYKSIFASSDNLTCSLNSYGGCTIGGSSAINAGLFFEPPASDYDLYFPEGWKSADMKCATRRLYNMQPSTDLTSQDGKRYLQSGYEATKEWIMDGLGFKDVDINAEADDKTEVFGHPIFDYENGQRGGPVVSYLQTALKLPNFQLETGVQVLRVERNGSHATGVFAQIQSSSNTTFIPISCNGTVILSAGAIQSPGLLMNSGIGPSSSLSALQVGGKLSPGISPSNWINNTFVGAKLFDNANTFIELSSPSVTSYVYSYDSPPPTDEALYLNNRSGPYTFASETAVFWDTLTRPDGSIAGFQGTVDSSGYGEFLSNTTITLNVYGTSGMKSRGNVVLNSDLQPAPDGNVYYSDPQDAQDISAFIFKIFQKLPESLTALNLPGNSTLPEIEKYITTYSQYAVGSVNHWSSSCEIGKCVETNLAVKGMKNLHVVDASIVAPLTVNPQFGIMVAAERGSELILEGLRRGSSTVHNSNLPNHKPQGPSETSFPSENLTQKVKMTTQNISLILARHPTGYPIPGEDLILQSTPINLTEPPPPGGLLLKTLALSLDPLQNHGIFLVLLSDNPLYTRGSTILGPGTFSTYQVIPSHIASLPVLHGGFTLLSNPLNLNPHLFLGALGMSGLTAYSSFYSLLKSSRFTKSNPAKEFDIELAVIPEIRCHAKLYCHLSRSLIFTV
ncbi:hypothetical protein G7Y89_g5127 [Cudoniella acicularis]|uniref:Glucose-methanol-choline oxidoreductase N-terminal domain-containing protein n=1 Tax=Cudoniella acicularis TaxID=354080 RepID=A0A8H4RQ98_9HELO|nr:hypothetical protein G7Y89_g5127 [Cudoniella acicularis]